MEVSSNKLYEFTNVLIQRGLGIFGPEKMKEICQQSGILLKDDNTFEFQTNDSHAVIKKLILNYAKSNLPAKMTAVALARQYDIPLPEELSKKRKLRSRLLRIFKKQ